MSGILYTTTCPHCPKTFHHLKFETLITVDNSAMGVSADAQRLMQKFAEHMQQKHVEHCGELVIMPGNLSVLVLLKMLGQKTQDQSINVVVDWMRHGIRKYVGFSVPDEKIMAQVAALGLLPEDCPKVFDAMKQLRDALEERPPFEPRIPGEQTDVLGPEPTTSAQTTPSGSDIARP